MESKFVRGLWCLCVRSCERFLIGVGDMAEFMQGEVRVVLVRMLVRVVDLARELIGCRRSIQVTG